MNLQPHGLEKWRADLPRQTQGEIIAQAIRFCFALELRIDAVEKPGAPFEVTLFNCFVRDCAEVIPLEMVPMILPSDDAAAYEQEIIRDPAGEWAWVVQRRSAGFAVLLREGTAPGVLEDVDLPGLILNLVLAVSILEAGNSLVAYGDPAAIPPGDIGPFRLLDLPGARRPLAKPKFYYFDDVLAFGDRLEHEFVFWVRVPHSADPETLHSVLAAHQLSPSPLRRPPPRRLPGLYLMACLAIALGVLSPRAHWFSMTGESWGLGWPLPAIHVKYGIIDPSLPPALHLQPTYSAIVLDALLAVLIFSVCLWIWSCATKSRGPKNSAPGLRK